MRRTQLIEGHPHGRVPADVRRRQILDVAVRLFAERGYEQTSLKDIAAAAHVARGVVYDHFADRDAVYLACVRRSRTELDAMVDAAGGADAEPLARLAAGIDAYLRFVEDHGDAWDVLFGVGAATAGDVGREVTALRFATVDRITAQFAAVAPAADPVRVAAWAHAVSGAIEQLTKWWRLHPEVGREQVAQYLIETIWTGLGAAVSGE